MSKIEIRKSYVATNSFDYSAVEPSNMNFKEEDIEKYIEVHPFPVDVKYGKDDLIYDLTESGGALTFDHEIQESTIEYISKILNYLINKE